MEFRLPDIGEGVAEAEIVRWLVAEGDDVHENQELVEVLTDKATVILPAPATGRLARLCVAEGAIVPVGTVLVEIEEASPAREPAVAPSVDTEPEPEPEPEPSVAPAATDAAPRVDGSDARQVKAMPATRKLAKELGVDLALVAGTGPGGRVTNEDVRAAAAAVETVPPIELASPLPEPPVAPPAPESEPVETLPPIEVASPLPEPQAAPPAPEPAPAPAAAASPPAPAAATTAPTPEPAPAAAAGPEASATAKGLLEGERIPLRGLRRKIADAMVHSARTIPHFTFVAEVDMSAVVALRESLQPIAAQRNVKLTFLPFIVRALLPALRAYPLLNSSLDDQRDEIVLKRRYHIGIATATENGLLVPVVRNADRLDLWSLAGEIDRLATGGRAGTLGLTELTGSTFTITTTGAKGGVLATPIINHPEVAILGVHEIAKRVVWHDESIQVRERTNLSLSLDHRVVDGAVAADFLYEVKANLEDPARAPLITADEGAAGG